MRKALSIHSDFIPSITTSVIVNKQFEKILPNKLLKHFSFFESLELYSETLSQ